MSSIKTYSEMIQYPTFIERFRYLQLRGSVGIETFGFDRYLNQILYQSREWKDARRAVIIRDNGCDLADPERPIFGKLIIHHLNPITSEDIINCTYKVFDPEYLVCVSMDTHNAIHFGDEDLLFTGITERTENDTCPWRI